MFHALISMNFNTPFLSHRGFSHNISFFVAYTSYSVNTTPKWRKIIWSTLTCFLLRSLICILVLFLCWWWIDLIFGQQQIEHSVSWWNWSGLIIQSPLLAIQYLFYTVAQIPNVEVTLLWINIYVKISCFGESHSVILMQGRKPPFEAVNKNLLKSSLHLHIIAAEINLGETMALICSRYCT